MKLIKFFFTIPFSPKKEWKKANAEISMSRNLNEDALILLLLMTFLSIGYSYVDDVFRGSEYFSIESAIMKYFKLLFVTILTVIGIRMFGAGLSLKKIEFRKLFIIVVLGGGLINLLSNFIFLFLAENLMYSLFGPSALNFVFLCLAAICIFKGLTFHYGPNFDDKKVTKNTAAVIVIVLLLFALNFLYMGVLA